MFFLTRIKSTLQKIRSALWFRPTLFCFGGFLFAVAALPLEGPLSQYFADDVPYIRESAVSDLLTILAGGMLTITTVTLSALILVLSIASGQASPRSVPELMADKVSQNALSAFLATFVFAVTSQSLIGFGSLTQVSVTYIFVVAILMGAAAVKYLVQWIHHVASNLQLNRIANRVFLKAQDSLMKYIKGRESCTDAGDAGGAAETTSLRPRTAGYIQFVDSKRLTELAEECDIRIKLDLREGDFAQPWKTLMQVDSSHGLGDSETRDLISCVVVGAERTGDGDPLFGFELLAEIACRALSPSLNDPQTALVCIRYLETLLCRAAQVPPDGFARTLVKGGKVALCPIRLTDMLERSVRPVARDGRAHVEVLCALIEMLHLVAHSAVDGAYRSELLDELGRVEEQACKGLALERDKEVLLCLAKDFREALKAG